MSEKDRDNDKEPLVEIVDDEPLIEIIDGPPPASKAHPAALAFAAKVKSGKASRTELIEEAQRLSGIKIYDVGTFSGMELGHALTTAVSWTLNGTRPISDGFSEHAKKLRPHATKHLVLGHGFGSGAGWSLIRAGKVQDYVDRNVPKDEEAWVVSCKTGEPQNLVLLAGDTVVSRGVHKNINGTPGNARQL